MIIDNPNISPYPPHTADGCVTSDNSTFLRKPGLVLKLWKELREKVGVIEAKRKPGMKFDTRSADDTFNKIRPIANELGLLIYPHEIIGHGEAVQGDDIKGFGTLASVNMVIYCQSVEDGSIIQIAGFGLGADSQDKAGGKACTYAFKAALLEALLAQGQPDTDDTDTPIRGGVKPLAKTKPNGVSISVADVKGLLESARTPSDYTSAREMLSKLKPDDIVAMRAIAAEAKTRCGVQ